MGMIGVSEAQAESVGSLLKRYSPVQYARLGTGRIIEHMQMRRSGVLGVAQAMICGCVCGPIFFCGMSLARLSCMLCGAKHRKKKFHLGGGVQVIRQRLKHCQQFHHWLDGAKMRVLLTGVARSVVGRAGGCGRSHGWLQQLARVR